MNKSSRNIKKLEIEIKECENEINIKKMKIT